MTLDKKKLREAEKRVKGCLDEGSIETKGKAEDVGFFLTNAENSLHTAKSVLAHTTNGDYDGSLWVVNASYYSIFYTARALLESAGIKLRAELSIHGLTFDAMVVFFYLNRKLEKRLFEAFAEAHEEAAELLGKQKANGLVEEYFWERKKRGIFTYETTRVAMQNQAETSYNRALRFNAEIRAII